MYSTVRAKEIGDGSRGWPFRPRMMSPFWRPARSAALLCITSGTCTPGCHFSSGTPTVATYTARRPTITLPPKQNGAVIRSRVHALPFVMQGVRIVARDANPPRTAVNPTS